MPMKPVRNDTIVAGDLTFHYVKWGEQGRPIVGIHGLTANAFSFQAWADGLATDYQLYAHDLRGRGDSDKPEHGYSVPIHAADLAHLIDAWGLERPIVIGHSLGALIALYFAAHYPDKLSKLVLVDAGAPLPWHTPEEQPAWLTASINRLGTPVPSFEEYIQRLKLAPFIGPYWNEYFELYFESDVRHNSDGSVASKCYREGILEEGQRYDEARTQDQWANVQAPTLLLRAGQGLFFDNDQLLSEADAAAVQQGIKQCQFVNFPTLNHYTILLGSEDGPVKAVRTFLDQE
jgi:pimeloyl-ACP methyl ester carboxylesterase